MIENLFKRDFYTFYSGKEMIRMVLCAILIITLIMLILFGVLAVSVGGAAFMIIFGDVFLCAAIITFFLVKSIKKNVEKNKVWREYKRNRRRF